MGSGDLFNVPQPGDRLNIPAEIYRRLLDTIRYVENLRASPSNDMVRFNSSPGIVQVRNDSGRDLKRGEVLGISDAWPDPYDNLQAYKNRAILHGDTPDPGHVGKFVILTAPLADGKVGPAVIDGLVYAKVDITDVAHKFADTSDGVYESLTSGPAGGAQIIDAPGGLGVVDCLVRLGPNTREEKRWGKLDGNLAAGGTATVSLWQTTGGGWEGWDEDSTDDETAYAWPGQSSTIASGTWVRIVDQHGRWVVDMAACP